jgi:hypothetical protein
MGNRYESMESESLKRVIGSRKMKMEENLD